jgi:hypothetical protein
VAYTVEPLDDPHLAEFLTAFGQTYVNGGVVLRSFRATNKAAFDHALRSNFRGIDLAFRTFLTRPSVVASLPELQIQLPLEQPPEFRWMSAFGVEGDLTHMLLVGGAYERFRGPVEEARALSRRFMEALFGEEFHRVGLAGGSPTPWTPWFYDIAWDATFVMQDQQAKRFVLLCMTDTD